jgi:hypothetical protein
MLVAADARRVETAAGGELFPSTPEGEGRRRKTMKTIETSDETSVSSRAAPPVRPSVSPKPRLQRVGVLGGTAVVIAVAGLLSTIALLRTFPASVPRATSAVVVRDQWYLDATNPQVGRRAAPSVSAARDRWYLDAPGAMASIPVVRDRWYLEPVVQAKSSTPSAGTRDRWYLESTGKRTAVPLSSPHDAAKDRWYRD